MSDLHKKSIQDQQLLLSSSDGEIATHKRKPGNYKLCFIITLVFLGTVAFFCFLECVAAFVRNTHILGFVTGAITFFLSVGTILLLVMTMKRGNFEGKVPWVISLNVGIIIPLFCMVFSFIVVKLLNYTQPNTNKEDTGIDKFFTKKCREVTNECAYMGLQSRVEHTALIQEGYVYYQQVSYTDYFLGLITDSIIVNIPKIVSPVEDAPCNQYDQCLIITCYDRIGGAEKECGDYSAKFLECMTNNDNEKWNECTGQGDP